ncbi:FG-GAP-like repeat-containing protein [Dactylosporangium sp. CA-139114]|uniref:FG-GAP-like repeat-containing protein n=1 Tax=Dactylosporangium sp. CA-139114 TaxID=3239931 RepID=UPI003D956161
MDRTLSERAITGRPRTIVGALIAAALCVVLVVAGSAEPAVAADAACGTAGSNFAPQPIAPNTAALRMGCARDAGSLRSLAAGDNDMVSVVDFNITERPDQWQQLMRGVVDTTHADQGRGLTLSESLAQQARRNAVGIYQQEAGVRFNGSIQVVGNSLVMVIPAGEVSATANWWQKSLAFIVGTAVLVVSAALCMVAFNVGAPLAAPICGAVSGALSGLVGELMNAYFDGRSLGDGDVWAEAVAIALLSGVAGAAVGKLVEFAANGLNTSIGAAQQSMRNIITRWGSWSNPLPLIAGVWSNDGWGVLVYNYLERLARGVSTADVRLKIMPLGDSITYGTGSSNSAGYRQALYGLLTQHGAGVELVGSLHSGPSPDAHEGHPGWLINDVANIIDGALSTYKPNVVLLHLGTNDMNNNVDPAGAPGRLGSLIDRIFRDQPGVTVVVSTIVPATIAATQARISAFNAAIPEVVASRRSAGKHVQLVSMNAVTPPDLADWLHPNDRGYQKMAANFYQGILKARDAGWVAPAPSGGASAGGPVRGWAPQGVVASGTMGAGSYPGGLSLGSGDQVQLTDITGDGRADYLVTHTSGKVDVWNNAGTDPVTWVGHRTIALPAHDDDWEFADVTGDGRAELLQQDPDADPAFGIVRGYDGDGEFVFFGSYDRMGRNMNWADLDGDGDADLLDVADDSSVQFESNENAGREFAPRKLVATGVGVPGSQIRFADINGDRRADYLVVNPDSSVKAWLNGGPGGSGYLWQPLGVIATGIGSAGSLIRFADVDGDRRADYLVVDPATGDTQMWRNGGPGGSGYMWLPQGSITTGNPDRVVYADLDGDHRADYLQVNADGSVQAWTNGGQNPTTWPWYPRGTVASGVGKPGVDVRFADINGDSRDDYLVVNPDSSVQAWINGGPGGANWLWYPQGTVATGVGVPGSQIRFADINGDMRDDYLAVNPDSSVKAWLNGGPGGANWLWFPQDTVATGVGVPGSQIRFAHLYGTASADFLVLGDNGSVKVWQNGGPGTSGYLWFPGGEVASGVGAPGSQIQFADLNADGRDEYLDVDPRTGATRVWLNVG